MTQNANLQIKVENTGINATKEELEKLTTAGANAERATDGLNKQIKGMPSASQPANDSMKRMRNIAGGLGYQLQDVAVQAQSGTSAFVILGQQGSQIASVFGPGGIVAGAIIAIGAALVGTVAKVGDTSAELKDLEENALQLSDAFSISESGVLTYNERLRRIADTAPEVASALFSIKTAQLELDQSLTQSELKDSLSEFTSVTREITTAGRMGMSFAMAQKRVLRELSEEYGATKDEVLAVSKALNDFNKEGNKDTASLLVKSLSNLKASSSDAQKEIVRVTSLLGKYIETSQILDESSADKAFDKQNKSVLSLVESLRLEAETLSMTTRERDLYIAKMGEASESQLSAINAAYDQIEADRSRSTIEKLESQLLDEESRIDESYMRRREIIMANTIEGSEQQLEILRDNWDKYEEEYGQFQDRLSAADEASGKRRETAEARVSAQIKRMREGVISSGIGLLKQLVAGNEKAAKAIVVLEAARNISLTIQNTAAAQVRALAELGPLAGPPAVKTIGAYGAAQVGIIAANGVLQLSGGGGGSVSSPSISGSSQPQSQSPAFVEPRDDRRQLVININGNLTNVDGEYLVKTIEEHVKETDYVFATFA